MNKKQVSLIQLAKKKKKEKMKMLTNPTNITHSRMLSRDGNGEEIKLKRIHK